MKKKEGGRRDDEGDDESAGWSLKKGEMTRGKDDRKISREKEQREKGKGRRVR